MLPTKQNFNRPILNEFVCLLDPSDILAKAFGAFVQLFPYSKRIVKYSFDYAPTIYITSC